MKKDENGPLTFVEMLGSVFAAAFGVQSRAIRERDFTRGNVIHFALVGVLFTGCFVAAVVGTVLLVLS